MVDGATMSENALMNAVDGRALVLYDGLCGMCNSSVQWVIRHDDADRFRFAPQQSALATQILARCGVDRESMLKGNSVYLALNAGTAQERLLAQSDVAVNLLLLLGGRWRFLGKLLRAIPSFARNAAYRLFARNRYRVARQYEVCPLPPEAERIKFLA
jgi:predicted DCC family thiol-disulfide oxidoreductase YuxK